MHGLQPEPQPPPHPLPRRPSRMRKCACVGHPTTGSPVSIWGSFGLPQAIGSYPLKSKTASSPRYKTQELFLNSFEKAVMTYLVLYIKASNKLMGYSNTSVELEIELLKIQKQSV